MDIQQIRNVGIIAHGGAGKTTLAEALLFNAKATDRMGKVDDGSSNFDYDPEEIRRKITINTSFHHYAWDKVEVTLADTPGYINFEADTRSCLKVLDGAVLLVNAVSGVEVQTEKMWSLARAADVPVIAFVSKMDRERADPVKAVEEIADILKVPAVPVQLPIGKEADFRGVIDLFRMKAMVYKGDTGEFTLQEIPADLAAEASSAREKLVESCAESDDALIEKFLEGTALTDDEIRNGFRAGVRAMRFLPVLYGSALRNIAIQPVLDLINFALPDPSYRGEVEGTDPKKKAAGKRPISANAPFSAQVFKTLADPYAGKLSIFKIFSGTLTPDMSPLNSSKDAVERIGQILRLEGKKQKGIGSASAGEIVAVAKFKETSTGDTLCDPKAPIVFERPTSPDAVISFAVRPKTRNDEDKLGSSLARMIEEDPTLRFRKDPQTNEFILAGMGETHVEVAVEKLKRVYGVEVELRTQKIAYLETLKGKAEAQGKHKKQTGGRGQYGDCWIRLEAQPRGKGFEYVDGIVGGSIPRQYIPAVEKGIVERMAKGVIAGYPVVDVKATVFDGSFHNVDSSEMAFKIAGSLAFKKAALAAKPVLLEPIAEMEVVIPEENVGDIIGDLNGRRGRVLGVDALGKSQVVRCQVPLAEVLRYSSDLRSITSGRGQFTMKVSHYEEIPAAIAEKVISESKKEMGEEEEE
ncbi:MAG: elongation factor G [Deltaproteobacteria bacterium 37-65-8]|nr:elongation factor G [Deltaproteobacteria bacterium]OYV99395.1 MAG: elongation factor G [Deltaproteobacteria bacterium 37-65-8]HQT96810.1 elongation factor G [Thermodesulfobacteriota bacterium]